MNLDPYTYGSSPAAAALVRYLNALDSKQTTAKVSSFLVAFCTRLKHFGDSNLPAAEKRWAMNRAHESFKHSVETTKTALPLPRTLMLNVGKMHRQVYLKAITENT